MKSAVRTNLKPSGNEFIDGIPEDWEALPMKALGWYASSGIDKKEQEDEPSVLMVNYMDIYGNPSREIDRSRPLMSTTCPAWKVKECNLQQGDLVFTPSSETPKDIGLSALIAEDLPNTVFSYHVLRFRFTRPVELRFKKYLCNNSAVLHQFSSVCQGTTRQILNRGEFRNAPVALPSVAEQRAIATFLDRETGRVDRLVAKKRELIERLKEKRIALISRTVTRGLPPAAARAADLPAHPPLRPSGIEWIGDIPKHWDVVAYKRVCTRVDVGIAEAATHAYCDDGVPIIRSTNVKPNKLDTSDVLRIEPWFAAKNRSKTLRAGDLVTVRTGYPGTTAAVPTEFDGCQCFTLVLSTPKRTAHGPFFSWVLNSNPGASYFEMEGWGTAQTNISVPIVRFMPVPRPPLPEQAAIAAYLDEETAKLDALVGKVEEAVERLQEYRTALITAAVTGKIDVRNTPKMPYDIAIK